MAAVRFKTLRTSDSELIRGIEEVIAATVSSDNIKLTGLQLTYLTDLTIDSGPSEFNENEDILALRESQDARTLRLFKMVFTPNDLKLDVHQQGSRPNEDRETDFDEVTVHGEDTPDARARTTELVRLFQNHFGQFYVGSARAFANQEAVNAIDMQDLAVSELRSAANKDRKRVSCIAAGTRRILQ